MDDDDIPFGRKVGQVREVAKARRDKKLKKKKKKKKKKKEEEKKGEKKLEKGGMGLQLLFGGTYSRRPKKFPLPYRSTAVLRWLL